MRPESALRPHLFESRETHVCHRETTRRRRTCDSEPPCRCAAASGWKLRQDECWNRGDAASLAETHRNATSTAVVHTRARHSPEARHRSDNTEGDIMSKFVSL